MAVVNKSQRIRIRLKGFDHKIIDKATHEIVATGSPDENLRDKAT